MKIQMKILMLLVSPLLFACMNNYESSGTPCIPPESKTYPNLFIDSTACGESGESDYPCLFESFVDTSTLSEADRAHLRTERAVEGVKNVHAVTINWNALSRDTFYINLAPHFNVLALYKDGALAARPEAVTPYAGSVTLTVHDSLMTGHVQVDSTQFSLSSHTGIHVLTEIDWSCILRED